MGTAPPRILVVEDDVAVRDAMAASLRAEGHEVLDLPDGAELDAHLETFRPDLVVLDVRLPVGPDGLALGRRVRASSDVPMIYVTAADALEDRLSGFDVGADDYLTKPFSVADLVVDEGARLARRGDEPVELTRTEFDLLLAFGRRRGQAMSKEYLLAAVWEFESYDPNLVEVHVSSLRRKLEAHGPRLVHTVRGVGYVLRP